MERNLNETQDDLFNISTINAVDQNSQDKNKNVEECSSSENKDENIESTKEKFEDLASHPKQTNATLSKYDTMRNTQHNKRQSQLSPESTKETNQKKAVKASNSPK